MLSLINLLILFFVILIIYQIILAGDNPIIEGLTGAPPAPPAANSSYQPYDTNNPQNALILAQQNAGNIQVLKQQLDGLTGLNAEVQDISGNVVTLQGQVSQLIAAQQQYANKLTGGAPPTVTGTGSSTTTDTSNLATS
jgi:hypothetical protein